MVPLITAAALYLLFLLFGQDVNKQNLLLIVPIVSIVWYWGVYLVLHIQVNNTSCPDWFLDLIELLSLAVFGIGSLVGCLQYFTNIAGNFPPFLCPSIITWSAIALLHGKRK